MPSDPTTSLDLESPAFLADPYPFLAEERERHPVAWHQASERYLIFSHEAVSAAQRDRRLGRIFTPREPTDYLEPFNLLHRNQMMENEPPDHTRLRRPVARAFARGHVERLRPRVREIATDLLDRVSGEFDLIHDLAEPLPVLVISELLGVDASHADDLREWSQAIVRMYELAPSAEVVDAAVSAASDFDALVRELIRSRSAVPRDDLISDLTQTELNEDEQVASAVLLLNAGHEASVNAFGNGLVAMLQRGLKPGPDPAVTVEEMLRFDSAGQLFERTAIEPVDVGGVRVDVGERVALLLGSANRDAAVFDAADEFQVDRDPNPHVAFGVGVHFCIGAPLARMELTESLRLLFERIPDLRLAGDPVSRGTFVLKGYQSVPVEG